MKQLLQILIATLFVVGFSQMSFAGEHGGKEHGGAKTAGAEHGGAEHGRAEHKEAAAAKTTPSADDIRNTMKDYVTSNYDDEGTFKVDDPETGNSHQLELIRVHQRVGKTGDYYYSCADFVDTESGELMDLDIDVEDQNGVLKVVDVRIHKIDGVPRYTYDDNDNRIPLGVKGSLKGSLEASPKGSPKGSHPAGEKGSKEHGGQEHSEAEHTKEHGGQEHGGSGL